MATPAAWAAPRRQTAAPRSLLLLLRPCCTPQVIRGGCDHGEQVENARAAVTVMCARRGRRGARGSALVIAGEVHALVIAGEVQRAVPAKQTHRESDENR